MAGSKRWFVYVSDKGQEFGLLADESNTEAVNSVAPVPPVEVNYALPKNVRPRYAIYANPSETRKICCYLLTREAFDDVEIAHRTIPDPQISGQTLIFVDKLSERVKPAIRHFDSGLLDGDAEAPSGAVP